MIDTMSALSPRRTLSDENVANRCNRLSPIDTKAFSLARSALIATTNRMQLNRSLDQLPSTRTTSEDSKRPVQLRTENALRSTRVNSSLGNSYSPPMVRRESKNPLPLSIPAIFTQHSNGFISDNQLLNQLCKPYGLKNHPMLFHLPFFKSSLPHLEKLGKTNPGLVFDILSIKNDTGKSVLNPSQNFENALPFLRDYAQSNFNLAKDLLMQCDAASVHTLHEPTNFIVAWPILEMLAENDFKAFMKLMVDDNNQSALFFADNLTVASPYLIKLAQNHQTERLKSLLGTQDKNGTSLFHYSDNFLAAEDLLETLIETDLDLFVFCLSLRNEHQSIPLHHPTIQSAAAPYVRKLAKNHQVELLKSLLTIPTSTGRTSLHYIDNFIAAIPLMYDMLVIDLELFTFLLSFQDKDQKTPLHNHEILAHAVSYLSELIHNPEIIKRLLSIPDDQGVTPLHDNKNFKVCRSLFQTLYKVDLVLLTTLWTVKNARHETPLHDPENFKEALPILEKCATLVPKLVINILSTRDQNGVCPLHVPANFQLAVPLLKKLAVRYPQTTKEMLNLTTAKSLPRQDIKMLKKAIRSLFSG